MIIKATRLQAWAPAGWGGGGGGGARVDRRPPPLENEKKFFGYIDRCFFATFSSYGGLFGTFFSFWGAFSPCGGLFATFYFMVGGLVLGLPPPTKISAGAHDCKVSRAFSRKFFCVTAI